MRLKEEQRFEQIIHKSRFIACAAPCTAEEQCRTYIESIRKEFNDATHVCTAYICGDHDEIQRSSDNHEPAGTAGVPMLEALKKSHLKDVCVCVVRYFGGIKLGAGGLIRAYSSSVSQCLLNAPKTEDVTVSQYLVTYPYNLSGTLENWLRRYTDVRDFQYSETVSCLFETDREDIVKDIQNLTHGEITPEFVRTVIRQKDI
ncbi:MAG: YigZ family protein [Erysipelotrichaceae bacterium]|nr:YigZ family protein [Erysipelotrichaceae bacterium]